MDENSEKETNKQVPTPVETEKAVDKKQKHMSPKAGKRTVIISCVFALSFGLVGGVLGYVLHNVLHQKSSIDDSGAVDLGDIPSKKTVDKEIAAGTITTTYQKKAYALINYSLQLQASSPYSLIIGRGATVAAGVTQNIQSCTISTPEETFNQNISQSSMVQTADRYYDSHDKKVAAYNCKTASDWGNKPTAKDLSYDDYIQLHGKLLQGQYYATTGETTKDKPVSDVFLTTDEKEYEASKDKTKHLVNAVLIYDVGPKTVLSSTIAKNDSGYLLTAELDPTTADGKSSVNMKTTGGLNGYPTFSSSHIEIQVDSEFQMVSSYFEDAYKVAKVGLVLDASQKFDQYYFHSDSLNFQNVAVKIPDISDTSELAAYSLFPAEK
jgi:hypothetical protein